MNTGQINNAIPSADELRFEYDQLRKEILHNDRLTMQIFLGVIALLSALMSVTFGIHVQNLWIKDFLFLFAMIIGFIGLDQTIDRERSTFIIASYLRMFIEPNTTGIKWEGRLKKFRERSHAKSVIPSYGEFINYLSFTYPILIIINFVLFAVYVFSEYWTHPGIYIAGATAVVLCVAIYTLWRLYRSWLKTRKYTIEHAIYFDPIWQEIRDEEKRPQ